MTESVMIVLPLPPGALSPNYHAGSRGTRMLKARASRAYRLAAKRATEELQVESGPWPKASIRATFFHATRRRRDDVNHLAALKPAYDGIVDGGLLADDDAEHLETRGASFKIDKANPRVELVVERMA